MISLIKLILLGEIKIANQTKSLQEVTHLIRGEHYKELIDIELSSGEVIITTDNHPFWEVNAQAWQEADELGIDSILLNINDKNTTIKSLTHHKEMKKVYNLTVNNFHTYFVGVSGVLGHNILCGDKTDRGRVHTVHSAERTEERNFSSQKIDTIIDSNMRNRQSAIDENGQKVWRYQDARGNTYSHPKSKNNGKYIVNPKTGK